MSSMRLWSTRCSLVLLLLQLASACPEPPPPPPADTTPPVSKATPSSGRFSASVTVTLSCDDGSGSGCVSTHYTLDGSEPSPSSATSQGPIAISSNTTLKFFSVDQAGNREAVRTETYIIDPQPPSTTAEPAGGMFSLVQSVTLSCSDGAGTGCAVTYYTTDGSDPTTSSMPYTAPILIAASTTLKFLSVDRAGNAEAARTHTYIIDTQAPITTASPAGGSYPSAQTVTLACSDGTGSGCADTYYTLDGSTPTTGSTRYSGPISIAAAPTTTTTTLKFFSVDGVGRTEAVRTASYTIIAPPSTSAQINEVRIAPDGAISLPIDLALVTYVKPAIGADPAGFFLQAEASGPALFIAVNPASLSPAPAAGDRVSLVATQKATVNSQVQVTALSGFSLSSQGEPVETMRVDVSSLDLAAQLNNYESELISITGTLTTAFSLAGSEHVAADLSTPGNPSPAGNPRLRLPLLLQDALDLGSGCTVTAKAPLWRFGTSAQPSAWRAEDVSGVACPAPRVIAAFATSPNTIAVRFDRRVDPATVLANGSQFTFSNGLRAFDAEVMGREVYLITDEQVSGASYQVTVATSVQDTQGSALDPAATTASFLGYQTPAVLRISEVAPNISGNRDLVELIAVQGGPVANITLVQDDTLPTILATLPEVQVATGDLIVIHFSPATTSGDAPGSETTSKQQYPAATYFANHDSAWDFHGTPGTSVSYAHRVLRLRGPEGITQDGVAFARATGLTTPPPAFPSQLRGLQTEGQWSPLNCGGLPCDYSTTPSALAVSADWSGVTNSSATTVGRTSGVDTNSRSDWAVGTGSIGAFNFADTTPPTTMADPASGTFPSPLSVELTCADGDGVGCVATYYTVDGTEPTPSSTRYTGPISLTADTTLRFFSVDAAGNPETLRTEAYVVVSPDPTPPSTTATPASGTYTAAQSVTLSCSGGTGGGCASTYYTTDGSTPTTGSPVYTSPIAITADTTLKFFSMDSMGNREAIRTESYRFVTPATTSAQIAAIRSVVDGAINLPVELALVTYLKPLVGSDPAGFFLQAERTGAALFVAVDPATLVPAPTVGDQVSLVATQKATVNGQVRVTALSGFNRSSQGNAVEPLRADVGSIDLPTQLDTYESGLIAMAGTLTTDFTSAGSGHLQATLATLGTPSGTNLRLRVTTPLVDLLDLASGCSVDVRSPLWRFLTTAQASIWSASDLVSASCPAPRVLSATAMGADAVTVSFDRRIDPTSVLANGSQFTFDKGLLATAAAVSGRDVRVTTTSQTGGTSYQVAVSGSVTDLAGTAVSAASSIATFTGFQSGGAVLRITEANPNIVSSRDLVELYAVQGGSVNGFTLIQEDSGGPTVLATLPDVLVAAGDVIVIHLAPTSTNGDAPGSETLSKSQYSRGTYSANYDTAWDFHGGTTGLTYSHRVVRIRNATLETQDAVAFVQPGVSTPPSGYPTHLQALQSNGLWLPADCNGSPCSYTSTPSAVAVSASWQVTTGDKTTSARRTSLGDSNQASDWTTGSSNFGVYP